MPTFKDLVSFAWAASDKEFPRFEDLNNRQACQMAGAWLQENPLHAPEALVDSMYSNDLMIAFYSWLQSPNEARQAALLKLLCLSAVATAHHAIEAELERINESEAVSHG